MKLAGTYKEYLAVMTRRDLCFDLMKQFLIFFPGESLLTLSIVFNYQKL